MPNFEHTFHKKEDLTMVKDIKTLNEEVVVKNNYTVKEVDGILVKEKINKEMMNLTNKAFMDLSKNELQREIDYLWGQYDYISQSEYLPSDIKTKQAKYLWKQIDAMTTRLLCKSLEDISEEMKEMRKSWDN